MEVGLDLTKTRITKFNEFKILESSISEFIEIDDNDEVVIGLDLINFDSKKVKTIDLSKYGKDIK